MSIFSTMNNYGKMVKFSHTLFALPFAGLASVIAILQSSLGLNELLWKLLLILICMFTARSADTSTETLTKKIQERLTEKYPVVCYLHNRS